MDTIILAAQMKVIEHILSCPVCRENGWANCEKARDLCDLWQDTIEVI